jgi:hypothetical protein
MGSRSNALTAILRQDAVYWAVGVPDGFGGSSYAAGSQIKCRWQDGAVTFLTPSGEQEVSDANVYVPEDLELESYLYHGTLAGLTAAQVADPRLVEDALVIRGRSNQPDLAGKRFLRKVWLKA